MSSANTAVPSTAPKTFPFGEAVLVFKVMAKMFALTNLERLPLSVSLKCDPDRAVALREQYPAVQPGYHLNKTHWNTVEIDGSIPVGDLLPAPAASDERARRARRPRPAHRLRRLPRVAERW